MGQKTRVGKWRRELGAGIGVASLALVLAFAEERPAATGQTTTDSRVAVLDGPAGTMRADIAIRQRQVRADGRPGRIDSPPAVLRLDRRLVGGRWRSTLTLQATSATIRTGNGVVPLENPFQASRIEVDEDTGETRLYDRIGRPLGLPTNGDRARFGITEAQLGAGFEARLKAAAAGPRRPATASAVSGFFLDQAQRTQRRADVLRKLGASVGRVRGLDRYLTTSGNQTVEVLVDPVAWAPVEINTIEGTVLRGRTAITYLAQGHGGHVRQQLTSEQLLGALATDDRLVTDVSLTNIGLSAGGAE